MRYRDFMLGFLAAAVWSVLLGSVGVEAQGTTQCGVFAQTTTATKTSSGDLPTLVTQTGHTREAHVTSIAVTPDDAYGAQDGTAILWDLRSGLQIRRLRGHFAFVLAVAISADGRFALTGSADGTARLWQLDSGEELMSVKAAGREFFKVAFADADQNIVAATDAGTVCRAGLMVVFLTNFGTCPKT